MPVEKGEPLALEIFSFLECLIDSKKPKTDGLFGKSALEVALSVTKKLNQVGKLGIKLLFNPIKADKTDLLIIGEASGDEHSAQVVENVLRLFPDHNIVAIGGNN